MATLPETATWEAGIYQLEATDPVQGGLNGIDNLQGKQLANRTAYLKQQADAANTGLANHIAAADPHPQYTTTAELETRIAALVASAPDALNTLNELATALGDDPNFATTITNALAKKAPLSSPAFTDIPTAPTAPTGTSTAQLATTAFACGALSKSSNGYQKLPSGLIIQWGWYTPANANQQYTLTFPIAFPNTVLSTMFSSINSGTNTTALGYAPNNTQINVCSSAANITVGWFAIGY